jgi:predicted RecA/RadA family phage recombinase
MVTRFIMDEDAVDYTPSADVAAGAVVVQGDLVGVAVRAIPANTLGALTVTGVADFPKAAGAGSGIAVGINVYWDATNGVATATASTNKLIGKTTQAAADADTTVRVRLHQ